MEQAAGDTVDLGLDDEGEVVVPREAIDLTDPALQLVTAVTAATASAWRTGVKAAAQRANLLGW